MNPNQFAQQIKHELQQVRWPAGSQDLVFGAHGSVLVFAGQLTEDEMPAGLPLAVVRVDAGKFDEDDPGLLTQAFAVLIAAEVAGDKMGEHALIGGAAADVGRSAGHGVLEVAARARAAVQSLTGVDGAAILLSSDGTASPSLIGRGRHLAMHEFELSAVCTSAPHYAAPQGLRYEPVNTAKWKWDGSHCENRFDFLRYRLVKKFGEDYSRTPSDGTVIYTGTAAQFVGTQADGYTYTVFADYNSRGTAGVVEGSSEPEVGAYRVV